MYKRKRMHFSIFVLLVVFKYTLAVHPTFNVVETIDRFLPQCAIQLVCDVGHHDNCFKNDEGKVPCLN